MPEHVEYLIDPESGLEGFIVIDSSSLGPAAGGCRFWTYDGRDEMKADASRLAQSMSYKNALAGLPLGGGKAVLRQPEGPFSRRALFGAFGRAVEALGGRYVTAEDVGTTVEDMQTVAKETRYVAGLPGNAGRPGGDPSPWTARGVFLSMGAAVDIRLGRPLSGCTVAIQGLGHVGASLARMLHKSGAKLIVSDISPGKVDAIVAETGAGSAPVESIAAVEADVFAPCALGGVLDEHCIRELRAKVVCGGANNQIATAEDGYRLADKGVLYAPDFVVNAGGIINVAAEYLGWSSRRAGHLIEGTSDRLRTVFRHAEAACVTPSKAATDLAVAIVLGGKPLPNFQVDEL